MLYDDSLARTPKPRGLTDLYLRRQEKLSQIAAAHPDWTADEVAAEYDRIAELRYPRLVGLKDILSAHPDWNAARVQAEHKRISGYDLPLLTVRALMVDPEGAPG